MKIYSLRGVGIACSNILKGGIEKALYADNFASGD